jgi:hypothetical protein
VSCRPLREDDDARVLTAVSDWRDQPALAGRAAALAGPVLDLDRSVFSRALRA